MEGYRYQCECGSNISGSSIYKHVKTEKHILFIERKIEVQRNEKNMDKAIAQYEVQRYKELVEENKLEQVEIERGRIFYRQQTELLKHFEDIKKQIKKQEEVRVEKRGLPKHIAAMAYEHPSFEKSCMICMENMNLTNLFMSKCGHVMCKGCEHKMFQQQINKCPTCRSEF